MTATLADLKILALDCQATNANPDKGHLLDIGWIPTRASSSEKPDMHDLRAYLIRIPTDAAIPRVVQRITGITEETLVTGLPSKIVWDHLIDTTMEFTSENQSAACPTVIHFARFEEPFLRQLHKKNNPTSPFPFQIICTHEIAIRLLPNLPRRGIRALAGYFGHSMSELKRSADHAVATVFIWKKIIELLSTTCGITKIDQLTDWLAATRPASRLKRTFPMKPQIRLRLPNRPGIYRMLRSNGSLLYIGKAKSLKQRVASYFRPKAPHAEHTLEMLTQAQKLDFSVTGSALEAAILESDEIKRQSPPYNIVLRKNRRQLMFCSRDLSRHFPIANRDCTIGPLPDGKFIEMISAFGAWLTGGRDIRLASDNHRSIGYSMLALPPEYAPEINCLRDGLNIFQYNHRNRLQRQSPLRLLTGLGAHLWRERMDTVGLSETTVETVNDSDNVDEKQKEAGENHIWTPEAVAKGIENMIMHSAHLIRRARWFCLLSESSLAWTSTDDPDNYKTLIVFKNGSVLQRDDLQTAKRAPVPPGFTKSFRARQRSVDLKTYDRLRVVTTELRRLVSEGRNIELRLGPGVTLARREVMDALRWV